MRLVRDVPGCRGCPMFGDGSQGYVADELIENAPVLVEGQNPDEEEEAQGRPFVGKTGQTMGKTYFPLANLARGKVSIGNALRCRWQQSNELPPLAQVRKGVVGKEGQAEGALRHCQKAHGYIPSGTKLIVSQGEYALWSATRQRSVTNWRGWLLPQTGQGDGWRSSVWSPSSSDVPVLATVHLAAIFREPALRYPTSMDWQKVPRILRGEWPVRFPGYTTEPPKVWPRVSAFDTEFDPLTGILTRYSLYDGGEKPWVIEAEDVGGQVIDIPKGPSRLSLGDNYDNHGSLGSGSSSDAGRLVVYMHNAEADILHLRRILGSDLQGLKIHDTMYMHGVLWGDLPHDLEYLGSLFARSNRWKHLGYLSREYSAGDALGTWDVAMALTREMKEDPQSYWVYKNSVAPLLETIMEAEQVGLALDSERVGQAINYFDTKICQISNEAQAYAGYPINLGSSDQVGRWLYEVEGIKAPKVKRRAVRAYTD